MTSPAGMVYGSRSRPTLILFQVIGKRFWYRSSLQAQKLSSTSKQISYPRLAHDFTLPPVLQESTCALDQRVNTQMNHRPQGVSQLPGGNSSWMQTRCRGRAVSYNYISVIFLSSSRHPTIKRFPKEVELIIVLGPLVFPRSICSLMKGHLSLFLLLCSSQALVHFLMSIYPLNFAYSCTCLTSHVSFYTSFSWYSPGNHIYVVLYTMNHVLFQ